MSGSPLPGRRMVADAAWNYTALAVTAAVGAATTFLIAARMDAAALGAFAQLYAVHVIAAQIAVFGAHDSTQKHAAEFSAQLLQDDTIVTGGLQLVAVSSTILALALVALAAPIGDLVDSADVRRGLYLVAPGVACFALNKVLFAAINGRGELRLYAWMQLLRAAFVLAAIAAIVSLALPAFAVGGIFTAAELLLLPCLLAAVRPSWPRAHLVTSLPAWWRRHLAFGGRGLVNGILLETHLRVDVAMLGYFASDRAIGVYAFAALFAEAIYQVPVVIRTLAYPTIVQLASRTDRGGVARAARRLALASGAICAAAALAVGVAYPLVAGRFDLEFIRTGAPVLRILLVGMVIYAFFAPVDQLLLQSGLPGRQSVLMTMYVGANVVLNLALIPRYGLVGAALATAIALAASGLMLLVASRIWLGYHPGVFFHRASSS
jgi:O-antigen/teichoic acid export membrane protein